MLVIRIDGIKWDQMGLDLDQLNSMLDADRPGRSLRGAAVGSSWDLMVSARLLVQMPPQKEDGPCRSTSFSMKPPWPFAFPIEVGTSGNLKVQMASQLDFI